MFYEFIAVWSSLLYNENESLLIIVLGMMLISQMSEDEVETALSIGINTLS